MLLCKKIARAAGGHKRFMLNKLGGDRIDAPTIVNVRVSDQTNPSHNQPQSPSLNFKFSRFGAAFLGRPIQTKTSRAWTHSVHSWPR